MYSASEPPFVINMASAVAGKPSPVIRRAIASRKAVTPGRVV